MAAAASHSQVAVRTSFQELVVPELTNHYGTLYGANALQMMGKAAFVCASRHARCPVVMAKADHIEFARPVKLGEIIDVRAQVVFQGRASLTIRVEVIADRPGDPDEQPSISGLFMMVAVDDKGLPMSIPSSENIGTGESHS